MAYTENDWWSRLKTALVVAGITLLIWLSADQNVSVESEFSINVRLAAADQDRYAGFSESPYQRVITVKMKGRRNRLRDFARLVDSGAVMTATLDRSMPTSSEPRLLSTVDDVLSRVTEIRESRLTIQSADPENINALIDRYATISDVRVKPDYGDLKVSPEYLRVSVSASVPRFVRKLLGDSPVATAVPKQNIRSITRSDGGFDVAGILSFPTLNGLDPNLRIEFVPSHEIMISGRIETMTLTENKGPIQINWAVPDEVQRDYAVVSDQTSFRVHVDVTGPKERVAQLDARQIRAFVDVLAADVDNPGPNREIVRDVRFMLPAEFSDCSISPDAQTYQVRFRLEPRTARSGAVSPATHPPN